MLARVRGGYLAVGTTFLYGVRVSEAQWIAVEFLRTRQPVARTMTFLIYDFREEEGDRSRASVGQG